MDLSIVIPVYNEQAKISSDIQASVTFLQAQHLTGEIIVVDDGSTDRTAEQARNVPVPDSIVYTVQHYEFNQGKGYAVRQGVLLSQGQTILFMDSGACVPLTAAVDPLADIQAGRCHIAIGSRRHPDSYITRPQTPYRRLCSATFRKLLNLFLPQLKSYRDTQCGFKLYHGPTARALFAHSQINGFMFDIEILCLALQKGLTIQEFPLTWTCDRDSRLSPSRSFVSILHDLWTIRSQH